MKNFSECWHGYLRVPLDAIAGLIGWGIAYLSRVNTPIFSDGGLFFVNGGLPPLGFFASVAILSIAGLLVLFASLGLYDFPSKYFSLDIFGKLFWGIILWVLVIVAFFGLFRHELLFSRAMLGEAVLVTLFFSSLFRVFLGLFEKKFSRVRKWLILGSPKEFEHGKQILEKTEKSHSVLESPTTFSVSSLSKNLPDGIVFFEGKGREELLQNLREACAEKEILLRVIPQFGIEFWGHASMEVLSGIPVISISPTRFSPWGLIGKRIVDICSSIFGLVVFSPFILVIALFIRSDSHGPIFYASERVGKNGKLFRMWKFRSMVQNADAQKALLREKSHRDGPFFKMKDDPRVTKIGKFLRRTSLDEIPQLWNVLKGEMSLVGPRPHLLEEVNAYSLSQRRVLAANPGITGFAQISGRSDLSFEEEMLLDFYYLEHQKFLFDIKIIIKTIWVLFQGKGAD